MTQYTFGFLGLGLIGGSIARALKAHDESNRIIAFDTDRKSLTKAYEDGVVDVLVSDIDSRFSAALPPAQRSASARGVRHSNTSE